VKKGRHRRYEEARNLKRGPDLDIEALFTDLEGEPPVGAAVVNDTHDDIETDPDDRVDEYVDYEDDVDS
jgi:hypothetical protein